MTFSQNRSSAPDLILDQFAVTVAVLVRPCIEADLADLEWHGWFTPHRGIIAEAFARQRAGEVSMLVAESASFPVGQIWIDFTEGGAGAARMWAFRVLPCMRGLGIGKRLLDAAERVMAARGLRTAEVGCEKRNTAARQFYEKRGYRPAYEQLDRYSYETPEGQRINALSDMWILQKECRDKGTRVR